MSEFQDHVSANELAGISGPEGLLFTGEAIRSLTPEQIATIGEFANRMFGVELREVQSVGEYLNSGHSSENEAGEVEQIVPVTLNDFRRFATENGYSNRRAVSAWNLVMYADGQDSLRGNGEFPPIRFIGPDHHEALDDSIVDLQSIKDRLAFSSSKATWWATQGVSDKTIDFLTEITSQITEASEGG
jgi:hypothetical protein